VSYHAIEGAVDATITYLTISAEPHQPRDFNFPKREFNNEAKLPGWLIGFWNDHGFTIARITILFTATPGWKKAYKELTMRVTNAEEVFQGSFTI